MNFLSSEEQQISEKFQKQGFLIESVEDRGVLDRIRNLVYELIESSIGPCSEDPEKTLNKFHNRISISELNQTRLQIIQGMNEQDWLRQQFYYLVRPWLEQLVGNELAMQLRLNLSIQMPKDDSSLLPIHSDAWGGDSPFEMVVWLPLVDCYETKSMFLLPPEPTRKLHDNFENLAGQSSEVLFNSVEKDLIWMNVKYGEFLLFNHNLPHGNRVNKETETRWSINCRFKGVFSPYNQKKIGEFFEPITLRAASSLGLSYQYPLLKGPPDS